LFLRRRSPRQAFGPSRSGFGRGPWLGLLFRPWLPFRSRLLLGLGLAWRPRFLLFRFPPALGRGFTLLLVGLYPPLPFGGIATFRRAALTALGRLGGALLAFARRFCARLLPALLTLRLSLAFSRLWLALAAFPRPALFVAAQFVLRSVLREHQGTRIGRWRADVRPDRQCRRRSHHQAERGSGENLCVALRHQSVLLLIGFWTETLTVGRWFLADVCRAITDPGRSWRKEAGGA